MTVTNWAGNVVFAADELCTPGSLDELAEIVTGSARVRVLGTGHSFTRLADTGGSLVSLAGLPALFEPGDGTVRVGAGMTLAAVAQRLQAAGLALPTLPSLPHITVAGTCLTATHGSGDTVGSLAGAVRAVELVTASGEPRRIAAGEPEFDGAVVSLGALGVVTGLELAVEPAFHVEQRVYDGLSWDALTEHVLDILAAAYSVSVFTAVDGPSRIWVKRRADDPPTDLAFTGVVPAEGPQHPVRGADPDNCTDQLGPAGPWHERLPHFRPGFAPSTGAELQSEFLLPREHAAATLRALRSVAPVVVPAALTMEVRSIAAEPLWLSGAYGRDTVGLHLTWRPDEALVWPAVRALERALSPLQPRPHWGKLFTAAPAELAARYPRWSDFRRLRARLDPGRRFTNDLLDAWFPA